MTGMTPPAVDAQRQVSRLATHHLAADNSLGVLHRNAPLASFDVDDERHDHDHDRRAE